MSNPTTPHSQPPASPQPGSSLPPGRPPAHEDGVLESIGKAISAPIRQAADEQADEPSSKVQKP